MNAGRLASGMGLALLIACGGRAIDGESGLGPGAENDGDGFEPDPGEDPTGGDSPTLLDDALAAMLDDLSRQPAGDQPFTRYLLPTPYRDPASELGTVEQLERQFRGVAKLANSLSLERAVALPEHTGSPGVLRIDLRAYGWDRPVEVGGDPHADGWEAITGRAELALAFSGPEADRLKELARTRIPFMFARDFVATASIGDVYYGLLGVPPTLDELRGLLNEQVGMTPQPGASRVLRGAFTTSGVAFNPRVVERVGSERAYWQAFDLADERSAELLFDVPFSLSADATEVMFALPNGLLGFFIADRRGRRVTESPLETVIDPGQPDQRMRNAASCFGCHNGGVIPFSDEVRELVLAAGATIDDRARNVLLELYPEPPVLEELQDADNAAYRDALSRIGMDQHPDPIAKLQVDFRALGLDASAAAAELFVSEAALLEGLRQLPGGPLGRLARSEEVPREVFDTFYRRTLCALQREARNQPDNCP